MLPFATPRPPPAAPADADAAVADGRSGHVIPFGEPVLSAGHAAIADNAGAGERLVRPGSGAELEHVAGGRCRGRGERRASQRADHRRGQVRTSDLLDELLKSAPLVSGMLPRGCIAMARATDANNQATTLYVIEHPAGLVNIRFKDGVNHDPQTEQNVSELMLSLPHNCRVIKFAALAITDLYIVCTLSAAHKVGRFVAEQKKYLRPAVLRGKASA